MSKRAHEKQLLRDVVADALKIGPDVIVTGDFNTQRPDIDELGCGRIADALRDVTALYVWPGAQALDL